MKVQPSNTDSNTSARAAEARSGETLEILAEQSFRRMISFERKKTERSGRPFLLMLLDMGICLPADNNGRVLLKIISALSSSMRETDIAGWYSTNSVVGVMYTEIMTDDGSAVQAAILPRVREALQKSLPLEHFSQIKLSFHIFPERWDQEGSKRASDPALYPDLQRRDDENKVFRVTKRIMDFSGSLLALVLLSPVFLLVAVAIKLSSRGPVFFWQRRVGEYGKSFMFVKFRSMYVNNDATEHKEYVRQLIAGRASRNPSNGNGDGVFKLTNDCRITPLGGFLRRTSLDELPQLVNVLRGEMSLVGPRPAIPYEVEAYQTWHRRRVMEAKPGITGLWQINGRSRVRFDEMVRLDLQYTRTWSPWLDIKILLQTPRAVMAGQGAG